MGFDSAFEDKTNVYIMLELCPNQTLMEFVKRRRRITEPETALLMLQLLDAMRYLHANNIIHRDLKLGNLFISKDMEVRVGDFGLATQLSYREERKRSVCGTPNYIAPEILDGGKTGHSFEVDTWAFGVILYTMLIGRPPFETAEVKSTYKRIRENSYSFPAEHPISEDAQDLIVRILVPNPVDRPTLDAIAMHPFFTRQMIPKALPVTALTAEPVFGVSDLVNGGALVNALLSNEIGGLIQRRSAAAAAPPPPLYRTRSATDVGSADAGAGSGWEHSGLATTTGAHAHAFPLDTASAYPRAGGYDRFQEPSDKENDYCAPPPPPGLAARSRAGGGSVTTSDNASVATGDVAAFGARGLQLDTRSASGTSPHDRDSVSSGSGRETPMSDAAWLAGLQSTGQAGGASGYGPGWRPTSASSASALGHGGSAYPSAAPLRPSSVGSENAGGGEGKGAYPAFGFPRKAAAGGAGAGTGAPSAGIPLRPLSAAAAAPAPAPPIRFVAPTGPPSFRPWSDAEAAQSASAVASGTLAGGAADGRRKVTVDARGAAAAGVAEGRGQSARVATPTVDVEMGSPKVSARAAPAAPAATGFVSPPAAASSEPAHAGGAVNDTMRVFHDALAAADEAASRRVPRTPLSSTGRAFAGLSSSRGPAALLPADKVDVWVTCWVDVTSKYGLGYLLSNGCVGVFFNDATKIVASPDGERFEYVERQTSSMKAAVAAGCLPSDCVAGVDGTQRQTGTMASVAPELKKKATLLRHFRTHLLDLHARRRGMTEGRMTAADVTAAAASGLLSSAASTGAPIPGAGPPAACPPTPIGGDEAHAMSVGVQRSSSMAPGSLPYMKKWVRMRRAVLFRLSTHSVQVCFFDGQSVVLSSAGQAVTYQDGAGRRMALTTSSMFDAASPNLPAFGSENVAPSSPRASYAPNQGTVDEIVKRVRYMRDVFLQLMSYSQAHAAPHS